MLGEIFFVSNNLLNVISREDMEDVDDVVAAEETPERLPISKIGKSKSEEVHVDTPGDRATTGTSGKSKTLLFIDTFDKVALATKQKLLTFSLSLSD